jgi:hypothetical protein
MAAPIFVLGLQRSGTTWIANLLAGSGVVCAVAAESHRGVHESLFFSHFANAFGSFEDAEDRAAFRVAFAASDYFLLTGLPEATLDEAIAQERDHAGVFERVMNALAEREHCAHWLEKSPHHTLLAERLASRFPAARFVCVARSTPSLIASRLSAYGRENPHGFRRAADILRGALVNALYTRRLKRFAAGCDRARLFCYDAFVADERRGKRDLSVFLGLGVDPEALHSAFAPNSSHADDRTRRLSRADRLLISLGDALGAVAPLDWLSSVETARRRARGVDWPDWVWRRTGFRPSCKGQEGAGRARMTSTAAPSASAPRSPDAAS